MGGAVALRVRVRMAFRSSCQNDSLGVGYRADDWLRLHPWHVSEVCHVHAQVSDLSATRIRSVACAGD